MIRLEALAGAFKGQTLELPDDATMGRSPEATLRLDDRGASRRHCRVYRTPQGVMVEDLGSGNGTYVNGQRIQQATLLTEQAIVQVSDQAFRLAATGATAAAAAAPRPAPAQATPAAAPAAPTPAAAAAPILPVADIRIQDGEPAGGSAVEGRVDVGATMIGGVFAPPGKDAAKTGEQLRTIVKISNALQTVLDVNQLLTLILDQLFEAFPQADRGFLMLYDAQGNLKPAAARNRKGGVEQITISRRIVNEVTGKRVAMLSRDAMGDSRFTGALSIMSFNIRSMMCAPLLANQDLLGIIHVDTTRQDRKFAEDDLQLLTGVAAQTALAIASAKMHEKLLLRDRMERDLKIATQVQKSFLPSSAPEVEGMEFDAFYRSALDIGGDLYDFVPQDEENMAVAIGDVSGKGIPAALMMARMSSDVKFYSVQRREPKDVLPFLNDRQASSDMADVFVTMAYISVNVRTHEMLVGNAAHCKPLVRRATENDVIEVGGEPGFPLGVAPGFEFDQTPYALQPGDVVVLVTDGVTEAMNANHDAYGEERLRRVVAAAPPSAKAVLQAILQDVQTHVGDTKQSDDITCVAFGVKAQ